MNFSTTQNIFTFLNTPYTKYIKRKIFYEHKTRLINSIDKLLLVIEYILIGKDLRNN